MARSYENLMGVVGRSVFYRPERQRVRELLSRDAKPKLMINGDEFPLFDISMNGVSFLSPGGSVEWNAGKTIELTLLLHDEEVYTGLARVARIEPGPRGARVGLGLTTGFLDLPEILRCDDEKRLDRELSRGHEDVQALVPDGYRQVISEMVFFLQFYKKSLDQHEPRYRDSGAGQEGSLELAQRAYLEIREKFWDLQVEAARHALNCLGDREALLAAKLYTEAMVTPLLRCSPFVWRSYEKPLGYPGDYKVMEWCYSNEYEGDSAFGKAIHKFFVDKYPLSVGVRTRKDLLVELMKQEHSRFVELNQDPSLFRVISLGCGPAREVADFIRSNKTWPGRIVWTLIDQEEEALSVAYRESRREIGQWGSDGHLNLLNLSFVQLLSEGVPLQEPGTQHLIYSAGLFDYLRESRSKTLIRALYELLAPGGCMAIGNAIAPNDFFWGAEFLADWTLLYRTQDEMFKLSDLLPEDSQKDVVSDPMGAYYFLIVRKPRSTT